MRILRDSTLAKAFDENYPERDGRERGRETGAIPAFVARVEVQRRMQ